MVSGFISSVHGYIVNKRYVVLAKVRHSQRMNDPLVQLWIITNEEATVMSTHCKGCMAGLGECCSHIACVLFYLEVWARQHGKLACTQVKCNWILPSFVNKAEYAKVKDTDFTSARKLKSDMEKSLNDLSLDCDHDESKECFSGTANSKEGYLIPQPSKADLEQFYSCLNECKVKPVCLSLVETYAESFISKARGIPSIKELFDEKYMKLNYIDLLKECKKVEISLTDEQIKIIEKDTITQAKGGSFYQHRAGRIGASKCHAVCNSDPAQPSQSLIKTICYPDVFNFSTAATRYGCKHEDVAIAEYEKQMKLKHENFKVVKCGTFINKDFPFLQATPDFLCSCDCGPGLGEVKCPTVLMG